MIDAQLEKVDILRNRFRISYREAYDVLERNGGNVIQACIELEDSSKQAQPDNIAQSTHKIEVMGKDLMAKVQEIIKTGQASRIRIQRNGKTVLTIPTAVGAVGALFFPTAAVIAAAAAVAAKYEILLDMHHDETGEAAKDESGITNVHEEGKTEFCEIIPSISSGKVGSV
jgi:hypothetical protein